MKFFRFPVVFCVSFLAFSVQAKESLLDFYAAALRKDPKWLSAQASRNATVEKRAQALSGLLPTAAVTAKSSWNNTQYSMATPQHAIVIDPAHNRFNYRDYTLRLSQPLFRWQSVISLWQSDFDLVAAESELHKQYQEFLVRVVKAYFSVILAQEELEAAVMQRSSIEEQLTLTKKSYAVGVGNITELREAESRLNIAIGDEIAARTDLSVQQGALRVLVGAGFENVRAMRPETDISLPAPNDVTQWADLSENNAPEVLARRALFEKAKLEVDRIKAEYYPTVDVVATSGLAVSDASASTPEGFVQRSRAIGFEVNVPLFSGFSTVSKGREAIASRDRASEEYEYARRIAAQDAREAFLKVVNGIREYRAYKDAVQSTEKSVEANRIGYKVGVKSNIDVLNSQQQLFNAKKRMARARFDLIVYLIKLKAASGAAGEDDIRQINALLD